MGRLLNGVLLALRSADEVLGAAGVVVVVAEIRVVRRRSGQIVVTSVGDPVEAASRPVEQVGERLAGDASADQGVAEATHDRSKRDPVRTVELDVGSAGAVGTEHQLADEGRQQALVPSGLPADRDRGRAAFDGHRADLDVDELLEGGTGSDGGTHRHDEPSGSTLVLRGRAVGEDRSRVVAEEVGGDGEGRPNARRRLELTFHGAMLPAGPVRA
jgi:hypothetical protein